MPLLDPPSSDERFADTTAPLGLSTLLGLTSCLGNYARSAFCMHSARSDCPSADIWPIPPISKTQLITTPSARKRGGRRRYPLSSLLPMLTRINGMVTVLSFLALGQPRVCPPSGRLGSPLSAVQRGVILSFRRNLSGWNSGPNPVDSQFPKLDLLLNSCMEMSAAPLGTAFPPFLALASSDFEKTTFKKTTASFDAAPFLSPFSAACLMEPRLLRPLAGTLPAPEHGLYQHGSASGLRSLLLQWDHHKRLALLPAADIPTTEWGEIFEVPKDDVTTRAVFNRIPQNSYEVHVGGSASSTPSGHSLVDIDLGPSDFLAIYSEDLSDFYPAFEGTLARAATNVVGRVFSSHQFRGTHAYAALQRACARSGQPVPNKVVAGNQGLVMGDLNACDWAVEAHLSLLRSSGGFPPAEMILNRQILPRGAILQGVVIDDRFILTLGPRSDPLLHERALSRMVRARDRYAQVGLIHSEKKARQGITRGVVVGAELDGVLGTVGAEVARRKRLSEVSLYLAAHPRTNGHAARALISTWTHSLMFRRPMLCILGQAYSDLPPIPQDPLVYDLPQSTRDELCMLSLLAPLMETDLRARPSKDWFSTDASTGGLGATRASIPPRISAELYRRRPQRGSTHPMYTPDAAALYAEGELDAEDLSPPPVGLPAPGRALVEFFDLLELCCGARSPLINSALDRGLRCGPKIDLAIHSSWDLANARVFEWVFYLLRSGRVRHFHSGVPCTTFSIARKPALRSRDLPWGLNPKCPLTASGNFLLQLTLLCLFIVARTPGTSGSHEHPASAFSWRVRQWDQLKSLAPCQCLCLAMCQFGVSYRKATRLFTVRAAFLAPLERKCPGVSEHHTHEHLTGSKTTAAAEYPPAFCDAFTELLAKDLLCRGDEPDALDPDPSCPADAAVANEDLLINELSNAAWWKPLFSTRAVQSMHINLKELLALHRLVKKLRTHHSRMRFIVLVDSLVVLGAVVKGRSPSKPLNRLLQKMLPDLLGFGLYPGLHFVPTRLNSGDAPSRFTKIRGPRSPEPSWYDAAAAGSFKGMDYFGDLPKQSKGTSEWCRLVVKFCLLRGVDLRSKKDFDSTAGYPGEGPSAPRDPAALLARGHVPVVVVRRKKYLLLFSQWLSSNRNCSIEELLTLPTRRIDSALASYGHFCFRENRSHLSFAETLNAITDLQLDLRRMLVSAWDVAWNWKGLEASNNNVAMPSQVLQAAVALALLWGWSDLALMLLVGFLGMLRPGELCALLVKDFVFTAVNGRDTCFVFIGKPKMRRIGPRREHVRLDDSELLMALRHAFEGCSPNTPFCPCSQLEFSANFRLLMNGLKLPTQQGSGLTPASLRSGGATFWYQLTDSPDFVRFRGRWANLRMLEVYIQEVGAATFLNDQPLSTRKQVASFASSAAFLLAEFCQ